jgi:hypothetical protein
MLSRINSTFPLSNYMLINGRLALHERGKRMVLVGDSPQCDPLRNRVIGELPDLPIPPLLYLSLLFPLFTALYTIFAPK